MTKSRSQSTATESAHAISAGDVTTKDDLKNIPRGQPKSGRPWKTTRNQRYSEIKKDKPLKSSWEKKMQARQLKNAIKLREKEIKQARAKELEDKRNRREENKKRQLENEKKSEVVQKVRNTAKIKRMRKKQLRSIKKR